MTNISKNAKVHVSESCKFQIFQGQGNMPTNPSLEGHVALQDTLPPIQV